MSSINSKKRFQKIKPTLNQNSLWSETKKEIGFAVAINFCPQEEIAEIAAQTFLFYVEKFKI